MAANYRPVTEDSLDARVRELYDHLEATESLPVDRTASRWIGEAQAVVGDLRGDVDEAVVRSRVEHVISLLENVDGTDNPAADEHITAARTLAREIANR